MEGTIQIHIEGIIRAILKQAKITAEEFLDNT